MGALPFFKSQFQLEVLANRCRASIMLPIRPDYSTWADRGPMHELSVTETLLEIALRHARKASAQRISRLNIVIGELSSIVDESVQFYWDIVARDTIAEGAELHFERVDGVLRCLACGKRFSLHEKDFACPSCGANRVAAVGGDDFRLDSIEIE
jgi:hydrogenase nickel incorporation protein HypA/HybF